MARIAVVAGDGIGPEVVAQARKVLDAVLPGRARPPSTTSAPPATTAPARCCPTRCSTSWPGTTRSCSARSATRRVPPGVLERGLLLKLRFAFDQYVNLRPSRLWPGTAGPLASVKPGEIDLVVVREGTEGLYAGAGGVAAPGHPGRGRHRGEPEHPARRRAGHPRRVRPGRPPRAAQGHPGAQDQRADPRRRPLGPHLRRGRRRASRTSPPSTSTSTRRRCSWSPSPQRYDVVVTDNLFGDILTDIAAAVTGGIGLAASGCINPERRVPVDVRAGARLRAGHRRPGHRRPGRRGALRRAAARPPRPRRGRRAGSTEAVAAELAGRTPGAPLRTDEVGDRLAAHAVA